MKLFKASYIADFFIISHRQHKHLSTDRNAVLENFTKNLNTPTKVEFCATGAMEATTAPLLRIKEKTTL